MAMKRARSSTAIALLFIFSAAAQAHFVFVKSSNVGGECEAVVYFSEAGHVQGEQLPPKVAKTKLYVRSAKEASRSPHEITQEDRDGWVAMFAKLPKKEDSFSLEAHCDYGIYHGSLLRYRAKHIQFQTPKELAKLSRAKEFDLDVIPSIEGSKLTFETFWQGKPKSGVALAIESSDGTMTEVVTDKQGSASVEVAAPGLFAVRANHEVAGDKGKFEGEDYDGSSHYTTLTLRVGSKENEAQGEAQSTVKLPALPEAVSSFGGAVCDDYLYVYSGHTGKAHAHSKHNLSQHFRRVAISNPSTWEELKAQKPLQGLPLVAHGDKVYRIGGLRALNDDVDSPDLHSTDDFACFDPKTKVWTSLTKLPEPRSSHDAVVIGDQLFVVGGWKLSGDEDGEWHEHGVVADLTESPIQWRKFPVPFQRRALAASTDNGKLYVIGGMNADHDIVRKVSVYDPKKQSWNDGPKLPGEGMNGFGVSAWSVDDNLFVSGTDGRLHRLSEDGTRWETAARLKTPRFFHRLVPTPTGDLLAIGGASMKQGHLSNIEFIRIDDSKTAAKQPVTAERE